MENPISPIMAKFDAYPWAQDKDFMQGVHSTLGDSLANLSDPFTKRKVLDTILHSRIWWYASKFGVQIAWDAYTAWSPKHPASCPDAAILKKSEWIYTNLKKKSAAASDSSSEDAVGKQQKPDVEIPSWQLSAPKADLSRKADDDDGSEARATTPTGAYPDKFQALVEAVTAGKTVPGIRQIPNTVVRQDGITPVGTRGRAPLKPWERHRAPVPDDADQSEQHNVLDSQFPPLA